MEIVIPYKPTNLMEFPYRIRSISPYDMESIVLDVALQPRITIGSNISGEILEKIDGVVVGNRVVRGAEGFSHREYGLAIKRGFKGFEVYTNDLIEVCMDIRIARVDGAFLVACYNRDGYTSIYLASFNGLEEHLDVYRARPVRATLGYQSASVVFNDGRSIVLYQSKAIEIGMPLDAIAYFENTFYGYSNGWIVVLDTISQNTKPATKVENIRFIGFLEGLPVFYDGNSFYVLDGGSFIKRGNATGSLSAWDKVVVIQIENRLTISDPYGKTLASLPKDSSAFCKATKYGVICYRDNLLGIVDFNSRSIIEICPVDSQDHAIGVTANSTIYVLYKGSKYKVNDNPGVVIIDKEASVLKDHQFSIVVSHLLSDERVYISSPAKKIDIDISNAKIVKSSAMHRCGSFGVLKLGSIVTKKPDRVVLRVFGEPLNSEICVKKLDLDKIPIEAIDTVSNDSAIVGYIEPIVEQISEPKTVFTVEHSIDSSIINITSDSTILYAKLCCFDYCKDIPSKSSSTMMIKVEDCKLPAWIEVEIEKQGFLYHKKFHIDIPHLVDVALNANKAITYSIGGFRVSIPIVDYPYIPPLRYIVAKVLPNNIELMVNSKTIARGLIMTDSIITSIIIRDGNNNYRIPFSNKIFLIVDMGKKWLYKIELSPEALLKAAYIHGQRVKEVLRL